MKRIGAYVALLLGVFLLVLGLSVKFVVAPKAVKAPLQIPTKYQTLIATGDDFTLLNAATGQKNVVSVYITRHIQGDTVGDNRGDGTNAVYEESLCLMRVTPTDKTPACGNGSNLITSSVDRIAFNRVNGYATNNPKYDASVDGDSIPHEGLGYKFPIDTKKRTYQYFDTVVGKAFPMVYTDQEKLQGLTVYKFVQQITNQPCYTNRTLPSTYTNTRTVWVEPTTGAIIKGSENLKQTLTGRAGLDPKSALSDPKLAGQVALQGLLTFTDATQKNQAQLAKDNLPKIHLVRLWIPLIGVILGFILIALGVFLLLRNRDAGSVGQHQARPGDPTSDAYLPSDSESTDAAPTDAAPTDAAPTDATQTYQRDELFAPGSNPARLQE